MVCLVMTPPPSSVSHMSMVCSGSAKTNDGGRRIQSSMVVGAERSWDIGVVFDVFSLLICSGVLILFFKCV